MLSDKSGKETNTAVGCLEVKLTEVEAEGGCQSLGISEKVVKRRT